MKSFLSSCLLRHRKTAFTALAFAALTSLAHASSIVVTNGGFETLLQPGVSAEFGGLFSAQQVIGWTTSGYNYVFTPGSADSSGAVGQYGEEQLWGPGDGSDNGLPAASPDGGNYLALDGAFSVGAVSQTVTGLTPGAAVNVTFYFAGAQQQGYTGLNTEQLEVSLGDANQFTPVVDNVSEGFTGWEQYTFTYTPTSSSEVLSFLAIGTPSGQPPMSLLDGVTVTPQSMPSVPEPSSIALLMTGFAGVGGMVRMRFKKSGN
jgi:hypothetical protein